MSELNSVIVAGAGLAGAQTAAALRAQGFVGHVTVLGRGGLLPYDRPPLSKELFARDAPADLATDIGADVRTHGDDVRLDDPAESLEVLAGAVRVTTISGSVLTADAVVVAVGARPVVPPGWDDARVLHTWPDAVDLRSRLIPGARLVCVGAGWIGAELSGVAARAGCEVVVVEAASTPLERQLGPDVGQHLAPWYRTAGVELRLDAAVTAIRPSAVELSTGETLTGDVVLAAVGARPWTDWLRGTLPMDARGSLAGDADGRVAPRVYAVGDCVTRHGTAFGDVPGGHWSAALHDPAVTVSALLADLGPAPAPGGPNVGNGGPAPDATSPAPYVFSQQLGHDLALFGRPSPFDEVVFRGLPGADAGWTALYLATDDPARPTGASYTSGGRTARLSALLVVDSHRKVGAARRLMRGGFPMIDVAAATDPSRPLRDAVRHG